MLYLQKLEFENYKNLSKSSLSFSKQFVCLTGNNGAGKTNLLDAIFYLSFGKSHFQSSDLLNIKQDENFFTLTGEYDCKEKQENIFCAYAKGRKKKISRNQLEYEKLSDHIGNLPLVIITPDDNQLITSGSEERRRFLDMLLSQLDHKYLECLLLYNKALKQRNSLLKSMAESGRHDPSLIEIYDEQLAENGNFIFNKRMEMVEPFSIIFNKYYTGISQDKETVTVTYQSDLQNNDFKTLLKNNFIKDSILQRTESGTHKDDLVLNINEYPAKKFASQGQQKTILLALKLAQYEMIKKLKGFKPILLLDDIFDRLDRSRTRQLIALLVDNGFGQTFITDTNEKRVRELFGSQMEEAEYYSVSDGNISKL